MTKIKIEILFIFLLKLLIIIGKSIVCTEINIKDNLSEKIARLINKKYIPTPKENIFFKRIILEFLVL